MSEQMAELAAFGGAGGIAPRNLVLGQQDILSGTQKAAIILQVLASEGTRLDLSQIALEAQKRLARDFSEIARVDPGTVEQVVAELEQSLSTGELKFGADLSARLGDLENIIDGDLLGDLREAFGVNGSGDPWDQIAELAPEKLAETLGGESPRISGVVLSKLPPDKASTVLALLPEDQQLDLTCEISQIDAVTPGHISAIGETLAMSTREVGTGSFSLDGAGRIAAILDTASASQRDAILAQLAEKDPDLVREIRGKIFTFQDIPLRVDVSDVPKLTRDIAQEDLITALVYGQGNAGDTVAHILDNMSKRMAAQMREEMQELGEVEQSDGEAAQARVAGAVRALADRGELTLLKPPEAEM